MKNKYYLLAGLVGLLVTTAIISSVTLAQWGGEMIETFENSDYDAWSEIMNEKADLMEEKAQEIRDNTTEDNFNILVEIHELIQDGDKEGAKELIEESDLGWSGFGMKGGHMMRGHMMKGRMFK